MNNELRYSVVTVRVTNFTVMQGVSMIQKHSVNQYLIKPLTIVVNTCEIATHETPCPFVSIATKDCDLMAIKVSEYL